MPYYKYICDSDTWDQAPVHPKDRRRLMEFDGRKFGAKWKPIRVNIEFVPNKPDFLSMAGHVPVCTERAVSALVPLLEPEEVEVLPLKVNPADYGPLFALNVPILDALDRETAKFEDMGYDMMVIHAYAFREDVIGNAAIFRIRGQHFSYSYVTEKFRRGVETHGLKGLMFRPLPMA